MIIIIVTSAFYSSTCVCKCALLCNVVRCFIIIIFLHPHFPIPFYIPDMHQSYNYAKAAKVTKRTMDNLIMYTHGPGITRC